MYPSCVKLLPHNLALAPAATPRLMRLALLIACATIAALLIGCGPRTPDITYMTATAAETELAKAGLKLGTVKYNGKTEGDPGIVALQDPRPGHSIRAGATVNIVLSGLPPITMPNLKGLSSEQAGATINRLGLSIGTTRMDFSSDVASGSVMFQFPFADDEVPGGSTVSLTLSRGPLPRVPNLIGLSTSTAIKRIQRLGLQAMSSMTDSRKPADTVIAQDPPPGAPSGGTVRLTISSGVINVTVPDIMGSPTWKAVDALRAAGLIPEVIYTEVAPPSGIGSGRVYTMTPGPLSTAPQGSRVTITVYRVAAPAPKPSPTPSTTP